MSPAKAKSLSIASIISVGILTLALLSVYSFLTPVNASGLEGKALVLRGPSPIQESDAVATTDLTLINEYLAVSIAVGSTPPWGVPQGNIIDAAVVVNGVVQQDFLAQFSFPVNGWGQWAKPTSIDVVRNDSKVASVKVVGYWKDIRVETTYVLEAGKDYLYVKVVMANTGASSYDLTGGWAISLKRGWAYAPGVGTGRVTGLRSDVGAFEDWVAGYHEDFAVGLWAIGYNFLDMSTSWVDPFFKHSIGPNEVKEFEAYLIFVPKGDTCAVRQRIMELKGEGYGSIGGSVVTTVGSSVKEPYVIVNRYVDNSWKPFCWVKGSQGSYSLSLPEGNFRLWAEARSHGPSSVKDISVEVGKNYVVDFTDVKLPGTVKIKVYDSKSGSPLDAKILIRGGPTSIIRFMSLTTAYTDFEKVGYAELSMAPGNYTLVVGHGADDRYGFTSKAVTLTNVIVESGKEVSKEVVVEKLIDPKQLGWYSTDLHHHSNYMDGRTPPKDLVVAYLAADLDFVFVSDHDWVGNHLTIAEYARARNIPFIPSVEVSPEWGHFNPYPIALGKDLPKYRGTACELFKAFRDAGAIVIRVNHPYVTAPYFTSMERNEIPGGYCPYWDVAEINGLWDSYDNRTVTYLMSLWDQGLKYYLSAGSDVHDIWSSPYTGVPRVYAYLGSQTPTPEAFAWAEKYGHTFITYGPLIFLNPLPGSTVYVDPSMDKVTLKLKLVAVDGLSRVAVVTKGRTLIYNNVIQGKPTEVDLTVELPVNEVLKDGELSWLAIIAWDVNGDLAITNPVWISKSVVGAVKTETQRVTETVTTTYIQQVTQSVTTTLTQTQTQVRTSTVTTVVPTTVTSSTTVKEVVYEVRWDVTAVATIAFLALGFGLGYLIYRRK